MLETTVWPWAGLLGLGALHGVNPGMGWLFAVALGLQEGSGRAVWKALPPLMAGHALAVAAAVGLAVALGLVIAPSDVRWVVGACLFGTGLLHLLRHRHPRFGGMRVGARDLVIWSFLMASAHGAGLMALPFIPTAGLAVADAQAMTHHHHHGHRTPEAAPMDQAGTADHAGSADRPGSAEPSGPAERASRAGRAGWLAVLGTVIHTMGYLLVTGAIAAIVYYRLGLRLLRRAWVNMDRVWAGALILTALVVLAT